MQHLRLTRHARQRLQQRGSRAEDVAILLEYGDIEVPARNGCRYVQLSHKEAGRLTQSGVLSTNNADRARRLVVLLDPTDRVVTAIKCSPYRIIRDRRGIR
jgi:Domain of unknown function (DUF4258)